MLGESSGVDNSKMDSEFWTPLVDIMVSLNGIGQNQKNPPKETNERLVRTEIAHEQFVEYESVHPFTTIL